MGPFIYVMAIMGCGDGGYQCQQARIVDTRFETMAQCQQAAEAQLIKNSDLEFPELMASCRSVTNQIAMADPKTRAH
ncbi:hypothetical protein SCH01S_48_01850 [Sphingomonas changbaiensis NBRC 104936]|uniref:Uncharacterized protein n=1 Tax=Sphingomonas changbaiensis NBRC 104936 TaxID=1219043 RepID=A0A0E9MSS6_9SPHN|nr:hypothetical protein [Sphingomonas changbaiensis]GAO40523.1 hypothetical protein SCH01S_48_01850 [Sphingomonas changbaiensis NBRC 104936]